MNIFILCMCCALSITFLVSLVVGALSWTFFSNLNSETSDTVPPHSLTVPPPYPNHLTPSDGKNARWDWNPNKTSLNLRIGAAPWQCYTDMLTSGQNDGCNKVWQVGMTKHNGENIFRLRREGNLCLDQLGNLKTARSVVLPSLRYLSRCDYSVTSDNGKLQNLYRTEENLLDTRFRFHDLGLLDPQDQQKAIVNLQIATSPGKAPHLDQEEKEKEEALADLERPECSNLPGGPHGQAANECYRNLKP
jgi:hypothetical protein